jgi:hypothetical protein
MVGEGGRDLLGGQHQPARGVQHQVDRYLPASELDRADDGLGVVDVEVAAERDREDREPFAAVDQSDRAGAVALLERAQGLGAADRQHALLDERLQPGQDEERPQQVKRAHVAAFPTSGPTRTGRPVDLARPGIHARGGSPQVVSRSRARSLVACGAGAGAGRLDGLGLAWLGGDLDAAGLGLLGHRDGEGQHT